MNSNSQALEDLRWKKFPVGSDGFVCLVDAMGDDAAVTQAARVSYGKDVRDALQQQQEICGCEVCGGVGYTVEGHDPPEQVRCATCEEMDFRAAEEQIKREEGDRNLIRYLMRHRHSTPFEMAEVKLLVRVPMDAWRQWIRHRTACLSGDTLLIFNRPDNGKAYPLTVKQVFDKFQPTENTQRPDKQKNPHHKKERVQAMGLRCLHETSGDCIETNVVDIWESGEKEVFKIVTSSGNSIRCSKDHRIHTPAGWTTCENLKVGDEVTTLSRRKSDNRPSPNFVGMGSMEGEEWLPIVGWEEYYEISSLGQVRRIVGGKGSRSHGRCKKITVSCDYHVTSLNRPGEQVVIKIAREMLRAFEGEAPAGKPWACHGDGNSLNDVLDNLRWGSPAENSADMVLHGNSAELCGQSENISSIEPDGTEMTYDLEVSGAWHNFSANGIVVHNSVNEYSTRYQPAIDSMAVTAEDEWRLQASNNKQGSDGILREWPEGWSAETNEDSILVFGPGERCWTFDKSEWPSRERNEDITPGPFLSLWEKKNQKAMQYDYNVRLELGVAREVARKDLPLSTYTEAYWKCDLHNILHFLSLRMDSHAQKEIRDYANVIGEQIIAPLFPQVWAAFCDYRLDGMFLTGLDVKMIAAVQNYFDEERPYQGSVMEALTDGCFEDIPEGWEKTKCRERDEFFAKASRLRVILD